VESSRSFGRRQFKFGVLMLLPTVRRVVGVMVLYQELRRVLRGVTNRTYVRLKHSNALKSLLVFVVCSNGYSSCGNGNNSNNTNVDEIKMFPM
jgi:hypothetical protein